MHVPKVAPSELFGAIEVATVAAVKVTDTCCALIPVVNVSTSSK